MYGINRKVNKFIKNISSVFCDPTLQALMSLTKNLH